MPVNKKKPVWYAVYTKPRCEKKVDALFAGRGIVSYCPLTRIRKKWSDRYKVVEEPLFKSYVFVHILPGQISSVRMTEGVVNFVYWLGHPAQIRDEEIVTIKKFLQEYSEVRAERIEFSTDQRVRVNSGLLMDKEGIVVKAFKNKVIVSLDNIGYRLIAEVAPKHINLINKQ